MKTTKNKLVSPHFARMKYLQYKANVTNDFMQPIFTKCFYSGQLVYA